GAYRLAQALPTIQVPTTVQAVLAARIDRLPPEEKQLLQTAAVIGTEVSFPLVQAIRAARGGPLSRPRSPASGRVPLRDAALSRARIHLHACPDARGRLWQPAAGATAGAPYPHCRGAGEARWRAGRRAGRTAGAPRRAGGSVGQGLGLRPT